MTTPRWMGEQWTRERAKEIVSRLAAGTTQTAIAEHFGVSQVRVQEIREAIGRLGFKQAVPLLTAGLDDERARRAQLKVLADMTLNAIQRAGLPLAEQVKRFQVVINDLAAEVAKLPETPAKKEGPQSPAAPYVGDLRGRKGGNPTAAKELRGSRRPGADYVADIIERGPQT